MAITYKVWVEVERIDEENEDPEKQYEDLGMTGEAGPFEAAHLDSLEAALHFAEELSYRKAGELLEGYDEHVVEDELTEEDLARISARYPEWSFDVSCDGEDGQRWEVLVWLGKWSEREPEIIWPAHLSIDRWQALPKEETIPQA